MVFVFNCFCFRWWVVIWLISDFIYIYNYLSLSVSVIVRILVLSLIRDFGVLISFDYFRFSIFIF